ncbi:2-oxoglutarate dehydrogenase E1 component [Granulosicoccus antarcticus]|uniref:2-oxoglutarate dehydrogenase E1 component n=1 Tax=Granulosicoccus antarcticus IMCC3135 TaxID=1192854 RepID=A0A2Z2P7K9_9GAMM|nr:2-oxoglutarate dehydrogenase E1 component [Granulosicoccus antarcticus]ASJ76677.1 2-oxoglutarate dehydrogenase E1 component [Granulosicoccus antarcticus IMCC3135]
MSAPSKSLEASLSMQEQWDNSMLGGANSPWLEHQYEQYLSDPNSVDETWRDFFAKLPMVAENAREVAHSEVREQFRQLTGNSAARGSASGTANAAGGAAELKQIYVTQLINAYRVRGHQLAKTDPLKQFVPAKVREVRLHENGLSESDLDTVFKTPSLEGIDQAPLRDIIAHLEKCYCGAIGYEFMYIDYTPQKDWLTHRIESVASSPALNPETREWILQRVTAAESMERHLGSRYVGQKRFSLEGGESLIVVMSELLRRAGSAGVKDMVIGMAHRGRLNVLVNILGKNPADLFQEFEGKRKESLSSGDVKYHQGFSSDIKTPHGHMHLSLAFNPSHLEIVSPVVEGSVRSRQDRYGDKNGEQVIPIAIHGDAAFAGQGVVMETFNMADSRGFSTKGTVHIIINNQIGFTTSNVADARSTLYATDVAKMINAPIFHVNGDDPEAVFFVTQLAFDFRMAFSKDVVIDMVCYRRHGHNETDEPSVTQPIMYKSIKALATTRALYAEHLAEAGVVTSSDADRMVEDYRQALDDGKNVAPGVMEGLDEAPETAVDWSRFGGTDWKMDYESKVPLAKLQALATSLTTLPDGLVLHSRVKKIVEDRRKMTAGALPLDWGYGETMAYATLLDEGYSVRLSGQDCGRGTFAHRHAVLHNQATLGAYVPLREITDKANFLVIDSVLSEEAVLGFEYGYATADPNTLVIWEAQFGDFANGAQVLIDQFISSGETKWGRLCGLTLLLPHGYEGQGPEHSSARLERFLQMCAEDNMQVVVPSTPAQAYHMLRRQMIRDMRRPLIVMTPKSLLRHRLATSTLEDLAEGSFQPVIPEIDELDAKAVDRLVFCSGKVYYDLLEKRRENEMSNVALVRLEQLYPFPYDEMKSVIKQYPKAKSFVWCQEEPRNQGAWRSNRHRIERVLPKSVSEVEFAGRAPSASPASGYMSQHLIEQKRLVEEGLGLIPNSQSH